MCGSAAHPCWNTTLCTGFSGGKRCSAGLQGQLHILEFMHSQTMNLADYYEPLLVALGLVVGLLNMQSGACWQVSHLFGHMTRYGDSHLLAPVL